MKKDNYRIVLDAVDSFLKNSSQGNGPVINQPNMSFIIERLKLTEWIKQGGLEEQSLEHFLTMYLSYQTQLHHPGYLGHQCAAPHYMAALGNMINGFTNNVPSIYEMGPASVALEFTLINWMLEKVGWNPAPSSSNESYSTSKHGAGVLVNGGSIANLTALIVARSYALPKVWQEGNPKGLSIMLPSESHYSLTKAAGIIGIGNKNIHYIPVDNRGTIRPDKLSQELQKIQRLERKPIALVANACNTPVGIYDPLDEIADFCKEHGIWLHVDGAHGASALLSEKHRHKLKGAARADSLVWDAHKMLQVPSLCAALLVKNKIHLDQAMPVGDHASYLFHDKENPGVDTLHRTIETTKPGLGERLFFVLGALGEQGMANFIDRQYQLTLEVYSYLQSLPDFHCPVEPESNILCFRYTASTIDSLFIRQKLLETKAYYLTTTIFRDIRYLRLVFMNTQTKLEHIKNMVASIREIAGTTA